jgi:hypothetical protein
MYSYRRFARAKFLCLDLDTGSRDVIKANQSSLHCLDTSCLLMEVA